MATESLWAVDPNQGGLLWGALVRATQEQIDPKNGGLEPRLVLRLKKAFPYPCFQLLGEHSQIVHHEMATYVIPSEELYFKLDSKGRVDNGLALHLQLWQEEKVLVKSDVILRMGSPLILTGPTWGEDLLLLILVLKQ